MKTGGYVYGSGLFPPAGHDHESCKTRRLDQAEEVCQTRKLRLTPLRRRVLEIILESHEPIGAYAILARLAEEGKEGPPTVYRALNFLMGHKLIHRVASLNAYVGCAMPGQPHSGQFLICRSCRVLVELNDSEIDAAIRRRAREAGFSLEEQTLENFGVCPNCVGRQPS